MKQENTKQKIKEFCDKWGLDFIQRGECGFGRRCVGISYRDNYIDYNPSDSVTHEPIEELYNEKLFDICPPDAYHKFTCMAVLGRGNKALMQLADWVTKLEELNVEVVDFDSGITDSLQAKITPRYRKALKIPI